MIKAKQWSGGGTKLSNPLKSRANTLKCTANIIFLDHDDVFVETVVSKDIFRIPTLESGCANDALYGNYICTTFELVFSSSWKLVSALSSHHQRWGNR